MIIKKITNEMLHLMVKFCSDNAFLELDAVGLDKPRMYERIIEDFMDNNKCVLIDSAGKNIKGILCFEKLDFDTKFFKTESYKITEFIISQELERENIIRAASKLLKAALKDMKSKGAMFIQCKLDARNNYVAQVLQANRFFVASTDALLYKELNDKTSASGSGFGSDYITQFAEESDLDGLYELSKEAYNTTRFHQDPNISQELADEMQGKWIINCYRQKLADKIIVIRKGHDLCGYVACSILKEHFKDNKKIGRIVLIATHKDYRGSGVGKKLIEESNAWFKDQGCDSVVVGTQLINCNALKFYQKNNFKLISTIFALHSWL